MTTRQERRRQERQTKKQGNEIPIQRTVEIKEEYNQHVGIYDGSVPVELCNVFVKNWDEAKKNETTIEEEHHLLVRTDEAAYVAPLFSSIYPKPPVDAYFKFLQECYNCYIKRYGIVFNGRVYNDVFKIHKVKKSEGFHTWHYERMRPSTVERSIAYMTYLEVPKKGGETEFLHQSLRIEPVVGRTLLWPAGFTHMHRGNPPLDGEKMYITGWLNTSRVDFDK